MKLKLLEESTQWANLAERYIGILKSAVRKDMYESNCPLKFWDYCVEWRVRVHNLTAKDRLALDGKNPYTATFGEESDISNICNYGFYELVYYWENTDSFPELKKKIGRCLGPCKDEGNEMAQYILKETGRVVARRTVEKIPKSHLKSPVVQEQIKRFDHLIYHKHGTSMNRNSDKQLSKTDYIPADLTTAMPESEVVVGSTHVNLMDALINAEFEVERNKGQPNSTIMKATVLRRVEDGTIDPGDREMKESAFEVEFEDGHNAIYTANQIAAEIYASVDSEGY